MSWRVETANPFALMHELPDAWAQTCFVRAPHDLPASCLLAILDDVHRVLRDDGTLWIAFPGRGATKQFAHLVEGIGWLRPEAVGAGPRNPCARAGLDVVTLFTKQPEYHFNPRPELSATGSRRPEHPCPSSADSHSRLGACRAARRRWCVPARGVLSERLIEWCMLAGSSPRACGVCGTAWKKLQASAEQPGGWRPACQHTNDRGRCLVLDPFCGLGDVGEIAVRLGRSYLGIEQDQEIARRARRKLSDAHLEPRR